MITQKKVEETVCQIYREAVINLPEDVKNALKTAYEREEDKTARLNLETVLENIETASKSGIPMCQDTGLPIVFVKLGNVEVENLYEGIRQGVARATREVPLRPNVVDPLTRENTGNNLGKDIPQINMELVDEDILELTVFPKGFGS